MSKRINLFKIRSKSHFSSEVAILIDWAKKISLVLCLIFFIAFLVVNYLIIKNKLKLNQLNSQKENDLKYLIDNKTDEAKLQYFKTKQKQLSDYYGEDAAFLPYYKVLLQALEPASDSAVLESVTIDNNRDSTFIVKIYDYDQAINFLKFVESDDFINNFDRLILTGFDLYQQTDDSNSNEKDSYQFSFKGNFKSLNVTL